jgi:hypothetical protein
MIRYHLYRLVAGDTTNEKGPYHQTLKFDYR